MICSSIRYLYWNYLFLVLVICSFYSMSVKCYPNAWPFFEKLDFITSHKTARKDPGNLIIIPKNQNQAYIVSSSFNQKGRISVYEIISSENNYEFNNDLGISVTIDSLGYDLGFSYALSYKGDGIKEPFRIYCGYKYY